tara:strand:- start:37 stop:384 length:348 start_codon:yes stop_codon:yes gene_type:complete
MKETEFIEKVFELAFGDNAILGYGRNGVYRDFSFQDVLTKLKEDSKALSHYEDNTIVAYDRSQLDDAIGKKATDADWAVCQNAIHDNDYAWSAMSDACANAEETVAEMESEVAHG